MGKLAGSHNYITVGVVEIGFLDNYLVGERTITSIRLAVIYYSSGGTNYQLAKWAEEGAREVGAEVKVLKVPETAPQAAIESNLGWENTF